MQVEIIEDEEVPEELRCGEINCLCDTFSNRYCLNPFLVVVLVSYVRKGGRSCK